MVADDAVNSASGRLQGDVDRFRQDLQKLGQDFANLLRHGLSSGRTATTDMGGRFKNMPGAVGGKVGNAIESQPLAVIGTAFAAGILAGILLRKRD